jgi:hypothetical protein
MNSESESSDMVSPSDISISHTSFFDKRLFAYIFHKKAYSETVRIFKKINPKKS